MTTIACVLRSGGPYGPEYVQRLHAGVFRFAPHHRFIAFTDCPVPGVPVTPLQSDWPKWWPKIELFRPGLFTHDRVLYLDLDTIVCGELDDVFALIETGRTGILSDFYQGSRNGMIGSGMMFWTGDALADAWSAFIAEPKRVMKKHGARMDHFLRPFFADAVRIQDELPGQVLSYKAHVRKAASVPNGARIVCFHGSPRPHELDRRHELFRIWTDTDREG